MSQREITSKIPKLRFREFQGEWKTKKFSNLLTPELRPTEKPDKPYLALWVRSHFKWLFQKPESDPKDIEMDTLYIVKKNDLVINITFWWEWAVAIADKKDEGGLVSHRFPTYTFDLDNCIPTFFRFIYPNNNFKRVLWIISPWGAWRNRVLSKKDLLKVEFTIPEVTEQQKIASFLSLIDEKIEKLKTKKSLLEKYKKWVMKKIFSREIRFWDESGKEFGEWKRFILSEMWDTYGGLSWKTKEDFWEGEKYITYKQIFADSRIRIEKCEKVRINNGEKQNKAKYGDSFFTVSSETPDEIGLSSVLLDKTEWLYLNSFCFWFRPISLEILTPEFACFLFRSPSFRRDIIQLAQWSTRYNMSKIQFLKIITFIPEKKEQIKIASFLSELDKKINTINTEIGKVEKWKKGLLQNMFI